MKETSYISKEQALKEQSEAMGTDPAEFLGYNPLQLLLKSKLNADYANSDSISWIEQENYAEQESYGNQLSSGFTGCSEQQYTENQIFCYWDWLRCLPLFLLR